MRSFMNTVTGTKSHVSANCRKRSVVVAVDTHGLLCALHDARFLLAWLTRYVQAARMVVQRHRLEPVAAGAMGMSEPAGSVITPSRFRPGWTRVRDTFRRSLSP